MRGLRKNQKKKGARRETVVRRGKEEAEETKEYEVEQQSESDKLVFDHAVPHFNAEKEKSYSNQDTLLKPSARHRAMEMNSYYSPSLNPEQAMKSRGTNTLLVE